MEKFTIFQRGEAGHPKEAPSDLKPLPLYGKGALLDTVALPGHNRTCRTIMGLLVGNGKDGFGPASKNYFGFNLNFNDVPLHNANALHIHKTFEYFMSFSGDFEIAAGNDGRARAPLKKFDLCIVPAHVKRAFRNVATRDQMHHCECMAEQTMDVKDGSCALILCGIVGEPWVQWSAETVEQARKNGAKCTDSGLLYNEGEVPPVQPYHEELDCSQADLEACIYHAEDRPCVTMPYGDGNMRFEYVDVDEHDGWRGDPNRNYVLFVLEGVQVELVADPVNPKTEQKGAGAAAPSTAERKTLAVGEVMVIPKNEYPGWSLKRCTEFRGPRKSLVYAVSANMSEACFPEGAVAQLKKKPAPRVN